MLIKNGKTTHKKMKKYQKKKFVDKINFLKYYHYMKKMTKKQMKKLKGKLNEMNYNLSDLVISTTVPTPETTQTVCKTIASITDQ